MAVYRYGKKTSDINVQSDFNIKDTKSDAFIKNRPDSTLSIALDGVEQKKHYNPNTGSETINIDLSDTIITQDNKLNNAIASLEVSRIGGSGKYISDVSEKDGKISATAVSTASTFSSTSTTAINGVGVNEALKTLNVAEVGSNGKYIQKIKEDNGKISATLKSFDTTISSDSTDNNTPTSKAVKDYVDSEISNLNTDLTTAINGKQASGNYKTTQTAVSSPAASGNATAFIDTISQNANGVITVTKKNVPSATQSVAGLMSAADKTKLDGLATHTTLSKTSTLSGMTKDEVYYINTTGITTTVSAITNMGIKLTFVTNVATTIKYYNTSGTLTTKSMDAGTVFFLFSCGSGYTPNLYGTVLDINPSSTSVGQIYIKTK